MPFPLLFLLLLLASSCLSATATAAARSPEPAACAPGLEPCDVLMRGETTPRRVCYNPLTNICAHDLVCRFGEVRCGNQCIDEKNMVCHFDEFACPLSSPSLCGAQCFDNNRYWCNNGMLMHRYYNYGYA